MKIYLAILVLALAACGSAAPAPSPTPAGSPLPLAQLKFAVMDAAGKPAFCDPDFYPIARAGGEEGNAIANYPAIKADAEVYAAIVAHEHLPSGELNDSQKLVLYRAWKLLRVITLNLEGDRYAFAYRTNQTTTNSALYQMVSGTVKFDGTVNIASRTATGAPNCPICLAATTFISTPDGPVRVTDVRAGMTVWTETAGGDRIAAPVIEVGGMEAPTGHLMVHLTLTDGRELLVSPGHKTAGGRPAGSLKVGDQLDGSVISLWELVPYSGDRTYDLLPAGPTGHYWANGILLASTLRT
jgi:hypothetical protein